MKEDQKSRDESVQLTTKSPPQLIKQQKGFVKHALSRPSPSGKSKLTPSRPGSGLSHRREGSPTVLPQPIKEETLEPVAIKQEENPTSTIPAEQKVPLPSDRLVSIAMEKSTTRPDDKLIEEEINGKRPRSRSRSRDRIKSRSLSRERDQNRNKRYRRDEKRTSRYTSPSSPSRTPYSDISKSRSPSRERSQYRRNGRKVSPEEGEVGGLNQRREDQRKRDGGGSGAAGGDRYREKDRHRGRYSRSRSRSRSRERRRGGSYNDRSRNRGRKERNRDEYREKEYGGGRRHRRDSSRDRGRKKRRSRSRSPLYERDRSRSRDRDRGGRGGERVGWQQREQDYKKQGDEKRKYDGSDEYRNRKRRSSSREGLLGERGPPPPPPPPPPRPPPAGGRYEKDFRATGANAAAIAGSEFISGLGGLPQSYYPHQPQNHGFRPGSLPMPMTNIYHSKNSAPYYVHPQHVVDQGWAHERGTSLHDFPPPSPDASKFISAMASALSVDYSPTTGLPNPMILHAQINNAELSFRRRESHIWAAQQAQQERLLAAMDGTTADPFDAVFEKLGIPIYVSARTGPHFPIKAPKQPPVLAMIPFDPVDPTSPPPDPRLQFPAEYQAVKEWARRPLHIPAFKIPKGPPGDGTNGEGVGADGKLQRHAGTAVIMPSVSWSHSPSRDYGEPEVTTTATMQNKAIPVVPLQSLGSFPPGAGGSTRRPGSAGATGKFEDVLNAPSAPRHDMSFSRSIPPSTQRTSSHPNLANLLTSAEEDGDAFEAMRPMDVDEGYFMITLPDGSEKGVDDTIQYTLLRNLTRNRVPEGWPVYRAEDNMWFPLKDATTAMQETETTRIKESVTGVCRHEDTDTGGGGDAVPVWSLQQPLQSQEQKEEQQDGGKEWFVAGEKEVVDAIAAAGGDAEKVMHSKGYLVAGGDERKLRKAAGTQQEHDNLKLLEALDASAVCAVNEAKERRKLRRKAVLSTYAAPVHIVSAVHGALLSNRDSIRLVAKGILQSALRTVIEQQQAEAKKKASAGSIKPKIEKK